jgi:hypothetical protein
MSWLANIIKGKPDEYTHAKLVKYGIGQHPGPRAIIKFSKAKISFKADLDLEKTFIKAYLAGAPDAKQKVKGLIVSYDDRQEYFKTLHMPISWRVAKGKGATTYKAKLDERAPLADVKELVQQDHPTTFFLLSLSPVDGTKPWSVVTKTSFPKSAPGSEDEESEKDPVFTKGSLGNTPECIEVLSDNLLPDVSDKISEKTKSVVLRHTIFIDDIEIPDDKKLSFSEKRRLAKKRGRLVRSIDIDGVVVEKEYAFLA